jgi:hypothetical protein
MTARRRTSVDGCKSQHASKVRRLLGVRSSSPTVSVDAGAAVHILRLGISLLGHAYLAPASGDFWKFPQQQEARSHRYRKPCPELPTRVRAASCNEVRRGGGGCAARGARRGARMAVGCVGLGRRDRRLLRSRAAPRRDPTRAASRVRARACVCTWAWRRASEGAGAVRRGAGRAAAAAALTHTHARCRRPQQRAAVKWSHPRLCALTLPPALHRSRAGLLAARQRSLRRERCTRGACRARAGAVPAWGGSLGGVPGAAKRRTAAGRRAARAPPRAARRAPARAPQQQPPRAVAAAFARAASRTPGFPRPPPTKRLPTSALG